MVWANILGLLEPEFGEVIKNLALEWDQRDDAVKSRKPIRCNQNTAVTFGVAIADFAFIIFTEICKIRALQNMWDLRGNDLRV